MKAWSVYPHLYMKHESGAMHYLKGRRFNKLRSEIYAGRGGSEITALVEAGYEGFLGPDGEFLFAMPDMLLPSGASQNFYPHTLRVC